MKKIEKDFIPILLSLILVVVTIIKVTISSTIIDYHHYIGISLLLVSTVLYFYKKSYYIYIFGLTLLAGLFGWVDFYYSIINIGFGTIGINVIFLSLILIFLSTNKSIINKIFPENELSESKNESLIEETDGLIKSFEKNFGNKTETELMEIIAENSSYVKEAKLAAKNILNEKNNVL